MTKVQLRPDQEQAVIHLNNCLLSHKTVLDASDTGVGKTYTACGLARMRKNVPLIIAPKAVHSSWRSVAKQFGIEILDVVNIEKLKTGNTKWVTRLGKKAYRFNLPTNSMVIWDEAQHGGGIDSQNQAVMATLNAYPIPVLLASATLAESPLKLRAAGYLLGLHDYDLSSFKRFCYNNGCYYNKNFNAWVFNPRTSAMKEIHQQIFPNKGCRIRMSDLKNVFPEGVIQCDAYDLSVDSAKVRKAYDEIPTRLQEERSSLLAEICRARQIAELVKVPLFCDLTADFLEEQKSVVIFCSFTETLEALYEAIIKKIPDSRPIVIQGGQSSEDRDASIQEFQNNQSKVCIAMIQAGGVGISLHDLSGERPRVSLISPPYSAVQLHQALGRIHRAQGKTPTLQKIVFAANTIEEKACEAVRKKLNNITLLNDGDLLSGLIKEENNAQN